MEEPGNTAVALAAAGLLMTLSVALSRLARRMSLPVTFLFLALGMLAGSEGIGRIRFDDYALAFRVGTIGLVLILFDGGLNTSFAAIRRAIGPATTLATFGVLGTAGILGVAAHLLGFSWSSALLLGSVVSPTDAAAVFALLSGRRLELPNRIVTTLELESGLNDPIAVILTLALTLGEAGQRVSGWAIVSEIVKELMVGIAGGLAIGLSSRWLLARLRPSALGLLPVFTVAVALIAFGATTIIGGSGLLATYIAAILIGNGAIPDRSGLLRVHDAVAWISQVIMFLVLGLLSFPSRLLSIWKIGLVLSLILALVARPLSTVLCLLPFRFRPRESLYIGWVGLRGAVPIILGIFPILSGAPEAHQIFDIVFFIVVIHALIPGATVRWATKPLRPQIRQPPGPSAVLEISSARPQDSEVSSFYLEPASAVAGARISEVPLPQGAAVMLIARGEQLLPARPDALLLAGDHVFVFCRPADKTSVSLLFGRESVW